MRNMTKGYTLIEILIAVAIVSIVMATLVGRGGCAVGCGRGYSEGERSGVITKFSLKGINFKTWEGEMLQGGVVNDGNGNTVANVWSFTVRDNSLVPKIKDAMKEHKPVTLKYTQWLVRPSWDMDSAYEIVDLE